MLLGAGASVTSGIPAAGPAVELMAKFRWCLENDRDPLDPRVTRASYWPWLTSQAWFDPERSGLADLYPQAVKNLLNVAADRRKFFTGLLRPGVEPSKGYTGLAEILHQRWITTVLTTNFDDCLYRAHRNTKRPHNLVQIRTASDLVQFSSSPPDPQVIYIHGSVDHYTDKNSDEEVRTLDPDVVERIQPLLRDHPIIVVGYRGNEPSVMEHLFREQIVPAQNFAHGVYWCVRESSLDAPLAPMVKELADAIGGNFSLVPIKDFDDLFCHELWERVREDKDRPNNSTTNAQSISKPYDMTVDSNIGIEALDRVLMFTRLKEYSRVLKLWCPDAFDEDWTLQTAASFNLLSKAETGYIPTVAGLLLFGKNLPDWDTNAIVNLEVTGPADWMRKSFGQDVEFESSADEVVVFKSSVGGTLWAQLDALLDALSQINHQFRLKEETSRMVRPFAPLAIKEMIVNALAHRDYQMAAPILVKASPDAITVISPGGLVEQVEEELAGTDIESFIKSGGRNVKGYRNPVVADLYYGGGAMDHTGSGLADLWRETVANNGQARFGSLDENTAFEVEIRARPEAIDELTNTAIPEHSETIRYAANIIPISELPKHVWHAGTSQSAAWRVIKSAEEADLVCPSGHVADRRFYSLYDLRDLAENHVTPFDVGDVEKLAVEELLELPGGGNILIKLLSDFFVGHVRRLGMYFDHRHERVYFTRTDDEPEIQISYQARLKRAKRTVVKPRLKKDSDEVNWYEHKAFTFRISKFGDQWGVVINPGYAFTRNGYGRYVSRELTNKLSTRRAAKDFNPNAHNDVTFWLAMLSGEQSGLVALRPDCTEELQAFAPTIAISARLPTTSYQAGIFDESQSSMDDDDEMEAFAQELDDLVEDDDEEPTSDVQQESEDR